MKFEESKVAIDDDFPEINHVYFNVGRQDSIGSARLSMNASET